MSRADKAALAADLRDDGATLDDVAGRLRISRSYASELLNDPTGDKARARKARYRGTCATCGGPTTGGNGRAAAPSVCAQCQKPITAAKSRAYRQDLARPRRQRIQAMWHQGMTSRQIADELGIKRGSLSKIVTTMRRQGWDMPYRRLPRQFTGTRAG